MSYLHREQRRVLLVDENARKQSLRATILRNHEIEVHTAHSVEDAARLWSTIPYDLVLLAESDREQAMKVTAQIRQCKPRLRVALLVGPPAYIQEVGRAPKKTVHNAAELEPTTAPNAAKTVAGRQWQEIVHKVVTGWYSEQAVLFGLNTPVRS
jgi:DNA-binding NtrC family response regulator